MVQRPSEEGATTPAEGSESIVVRRHRKRKLAAIFALSLVLVLLVALAAVWVARRPLASNLLEREFAKREVQATYQLDRVGLRTQQISNLVIGDPGNPDLTARRAQVQLRIKWNGSVEVYRIVARGVRLRGRFVRGRMSWGQIDRLLPPPSDKPFELPNFVLDVADSSIRLDMPVGRIGIAIQGAGNLTGGFAGRLALASQQLTPGRCRLVDLHANVAVEVEARRPHVEGPVTLDRLTCPASRFEVVQPRLDIDSRFNESFTRYEGRGRAAITSFVAGANGLSNFVGNLTFRGDPEATFGTVELAAQRSRVAEIYAERTRLEGRYRLGITGGTLVMVGDYAANGATLAPSMIGRFTDPLRAASNTPIGPVATSIADAIARTARNFDSSGALRMVNFPGGGALRIETADARSPSGARVQVSGGDGISYYWPSARIRVDGDIQMAGGGLPAGRIALSQPRSGAPMSGIAEFAPYTARGSRLAVAPIRFAAGRDGSTQVSTVAQLDGPFPDGRVQGLRVPINGRFGSGGGFAIGTACLEVRFAYLQTGGLQLGPTRLPVCPVGGAIVSQAPAGPLRVGARFRGPVLAGRLGASPMRLSAAGGQIVGKDFAVNGLALRLGKSASPILFDAARLNGTFAGRGLSGAFSGARSTVGNVPLAMSEIAGRWQVYKGDLSANASMLVSDRSDNPRFYPLRGNDVRFSLADGWVRADGKLVHPGSGTLVSNIDIEHRLETGIGRALLDVPGIRFGENLQPDELTRLTEGVVALVQGTVTGQGRINWSGSGNVSSTGEFSTAGMNLAAPFGPVTGLTTTVRFTDLLGLKTAPGQVATIKSINPGILVENGVIRYQLLPNQMVKVERGEWPFMGGRLVLQETILNFGRPSAKRLTFQVIGLDAKVFVDSLGFQGLEITGIFDGVLPMIFDESGGRLVGGRLEARPPGGLFAYTGTKPKAGLMAGVAFDLLSRMRYGQMVIRLDGDLAGEFASRFAISDISLNQEGGFVAGLIRGAFRKVPLKVNLNITGPFRAIIQMAKGFQDPTKVIEPVMPFPLDTPGIVVETRKIEKTSEQTSNAPSLKEQVDVSTKPPESEK